MQADGYDLFHAVLDHLRGEKVCLSFSLDCHAAHVLQQDGRNRLCRLSHVDGAVVANLEIIRKRLRNCKIKM
jgi:hypothetical protein